MILKKRAAQTGPTRHELSCGVVLWVVPYDAALEFSGTWDHQMELVGKKRKAKAKPAEGPALSTPGFEEAAEGMEALAEEAGDPLSAEMLLRGEAQFRYYSTMGGLLVDRWEQIEDEDGNPIPFSPEAFELLLRQERSALSEWQGILAQWSAGGSREGNGSRAEQSGTLGEVRPSARDAGKGKRDARVGSQAPSAGGATTGNGHLSPT